MRKKVAVILLIGVLVAIVFCVILCTIFGIASTIVYLKVTIPSERELWRITDNDLEEPIVVSNLLLFKGHKGEYSHSWCEYINAVDKNTGKNVWSSESFTTDQYCNQSRGPVYTAVIFLAKEKVILISSSYWLTDDEQGFAVYAVDGSTGELLWALDGYAGYPYEAQYALLDYTSADTNEIYVATKEGSFLAIDTRTGKQIWKQKIPNLDYYADNIFIEFYDQVVYYYHSGDSAITAFDAEDGTQIWKVSKPNFAERILFSDQMIYLETSSRRNGTIGHAPFIITAMDTMTGEQVWELSLNQTFYPWIEIAGNKIYILTNDSEGWGDDFKAQGSLVVIDKANGETVWQFNEDYLHGDLEYLVQDNVVYIGTRDHYLFALDHETGKTIWQTASSGFPYYFHVEDDTLVVVYEEKYAAGFDIETGIQKWMLDVGMDIFWYPDDFILVGEGVIYIAGATNKTVYAIDIPTGKILWTWNHYHPRDKAYMLKALDQDVLYIDQYRRFLGYDWFFAIKTEPE